MQRRIRWAWEPIINGAHFVLGSWCLTMHSSLTVSDQLIWGTWCGASVIETPTACIQMPCHANDWWVWFWILITCMIRIHNNILSSTCTYEGGSRDPLPNDNPFTNLFFIYRFPSQRVQSRKYLVGSWDLLFIDMGLKNRPPWNLSFLYSWISRYIRQY